MEKVIIWFFVWLVLVVVLLSERPRNKISFCEEHEYVYCL
jgi:hypothetical protein